MHDRSQHTSDVRRTLRRLGTTAKKGLGQHFLVDAGVLQTIVSAADLKPEDTIIEVGPGLGVLTRQLAKVARRVIAVELDAKLASVLRCTMSHYSAVRVIHADILKANLPTEIVSDSVHKVVANLPYNIASAALRHFLESSPKPTLMVVMVQKEVAEAMAAQPGRMSFLSTLIQFYSHVEIIAEVTSDSFYPQPKVNSAILRLIPYASPLINVEDVEGFFNFVVSGFRQPRKQLGNSLTEGLGAPIEEVDKLLAAADIDRRRRAETLCIEEWAELWSHFN